MAETNLLTAAELCGRVYGALPCVEIRLVRTSSTPERTAYVAIPCPLTVKESKECADFVARAEEEKKGEKEEEDGRLREARAKMTMMSLEEARACLFRHGGNENAVLQQKDIENKKRNFSEEDVQLRLAYLTVQRHESPTRHQWPEEINAALSNLGFSVRV